MSFEAESSAKRGPRRLASARSEISEDDDNEILSPVFASAQGESLAGGDESDEEEDEEPTWKKDRIGKLIDQVAAKAHGHSLDEVRSPAFCASRCPRPPDVLLRCSGGSEGVAQGGASTPARAAFCRPLVP